MHKNTSQYNSAFVYFQILFGIFTYSLSSFLCQFHKYMKTIPIYTKLITNTLSTDTLFIR